MDFISKYLDELKTDSALLIKGKWGSGKTHYYKNTIEEVIIKKDLIPVYISVYGRKSTDDLKKSIMNEFLRQKFKKTAIRNNKKTGVMKERVRKLTVKSHEKLSELGIDMSEIGTTVFDSAMNGAVSKALDEIKKHTGTEVNLTDIFSDFSKIVLVVDDFERSRIDIVELMGNIYRLIEEESVKTILIANEEEIENTLVENNELKVYSSINALMYLNENSNDVEKSNNRGIRGYNPQRESKMVKNSKTVIDEITNMKTLIYNDQFHYFKMKEKLVGYTIEINQDITDVIDVLLDNYIPDKSSYFHEIKEEIIVIFKHSEYNNFRLLSRGIKLLYALESDLKQTHFENEKIKEKAIKSFLLMGLIQYIESKYCVNNNDNIIHFKTQDLGFIYGKDYPEIILNIYNKYSSFSHIYKLIYLSSVENFILSLDTDNSDFKKDLELLYGRC